MSDVVILGARSIAVAAAVAGFLGFVADDAVAESEPEAPVALEQAVHDLLSERESDKALRARIERAKELGASRQAILEARFLYHVDRREDEKLAAMLPELVAQNEHFELSESQVFAVEEDWLAILEYVRAIDALNRDDPAGFKKHITEAFWLSPRQGAAYASHIEKFRLEKAMREVRLDFARPLTSLDGEGVRLANSLDGNRAVLLHFFSPWSRECEATLGEFAATARALEAANVLVATVVEPGGPEAIEDTVALLREHGETFPGLWLLDPSTPSLERKLRIHSAPTMVLVAKDGSILFNGHPADPELWEAVGRAAPGFERPEIPASAGAEKR